MSEIKIGSVLRDNDPRMAGRRLVVEDICRDVVTRHPYVVARGVCRVNIRISRIHTDGKPRRSGFSLIEMTP